MLARLRRWLRALADWFAGRSARLNRRTRTEDDGPEDIYPLF